MPIYRPIKRFFTGKIREPYMGNEVKMGIEVKKEEGMSTVVTVITESEQIKHVFEEIDEEEFISLYGITR